MSEYSIGDSVVITEGADKGKEGIIYNFYTTEGITSIAVKFGSNDYGMYKIWHVEKL